MRSVAVKSVEAVRVRRVGVGVRFWAEAAEVGTEVSVVIVFVEEVGGTDLQRVEKAPLACSGGSASPSAALTAVSQ